jgi:hypothetical protein
MEKHKYLIKYTYQLYVGGGHDSGGIYNEKQGCSILELSHEQLNDEYIYNQINKDPYLKQKNQIIDVTKL